MTDDDTHDPDPPADPIECAAELLHAAGQDRLWLRAVLPLLQARTHDPDPSGRVQFACDQMHIAACERVGRILRSDLPPLPPHAGGSRGVWDRA